MPTTTVLMPVYNGADYVEESIDSILKQSYRDFELLIVNDASTDDTLERIDRIKDARIRVISHSENQGSGEAGNTGWKNSDSRYVALMDHDDIADPRRLEKQVLIMNAQPRLTVCGGQMHCFGDTETNVVAPLTDGQIKANLLAGAANIYNPTAMIRRQPVDKLEVRWRAEWKAIHDWAFWSELMILGARFRNHPDNLLNYRSHVAQQSKDLTAHRPLLAKNRLRIMAIFFPQLDMEEMIALEPLLQWVGPPQLTRSEVTAGLAALSKTLNRPASRLGEDRATLDSFLSTCQTRWENAMAPRP